MMKKNYCYFSVVVLLLISNILGAQVLETQNFENGIGITDFPGWDANITFSVVQTDPCEGSQSMRVNLHSGNTTAFIESASQIATGDDIDVSFDYKLVDLSGGLTSGNFGEIDLYYTVDGGTTWQLYDTIDQADVPTSDCSTHTATIASTDVPTGSDFAWRAEATWNTGDYYWYVDNFVAVEQVGCIQPIDVQIDNIATTSADISWTDLNTTAPTSWTVYYCITSIPAGATIPGAPLCNSVTVTGTPETTLTNLTDGFNYFIYVEANCSATSTSAASNEVTFQTIAIGAECSGPIEVSSLPYSDSGQMSTFGNFESGGPGVSCGNSSVNLLDGYEVFYHYVPTSDDILTIDVTDLTIDNVGVFVYESCSDVGTFCFGGATTDDGSDIELNSLFVDQGQDYYIVIASLDNSGNPGDTPFDIEITGFDCASWVQPDGNSVVDFVAGQTLAEFSNTPFGAEPTINGATLTWYEDNAGTIGTEITANLSTIDLLDGDVYWVTQNIGGCESPALQMTFDEFNCNTDLAGITSTTPGSVCESGTVDLQVTANSSNIYWYESATGGEPINVGANFTTPEISQTTSYYVSEAFIGQSLIDNQGKPGPLSNSSSTSTYYGLEFTINQPTTIVDVQVYNAETSQNTITVGLYELNNPSTAIEEASFVLTPGSSSAASPNTLTLNWDVTPGTYFIRKSMGSGSLLYSTSSDNDFPYALGTVGEITGSRYYTGSFTSTSYYYFYNWTIIGPEVLCETEPRTQIDATVYDIETTSVSADDYQVCAGGSTMLHVTSDDSNYTYAWEWTDSSGANIDSGADIQVSPLGNTTYTVIATNSNTGCEYVNTIELEVIGVNDFPIYPDATSVETCEDEFIALTAGDLVYDFEETPTGWTTVNNSTVVAPGLSVSDADWQVVSSPFNPAGGISSNDNSSFYLADASRIGPGGSLNTQLISPSFDLTGTSSVELEFYHYLRYLSTQATTGYLEVSVNQGNWEQIASYQEEGTLDSFVQESESLDDYVGFSDVRIRFRFSGGWGWYWAVDNIRISIEYQQGQITWSPTTDLYFDDQGQFPYDGTPASQVYFNSSQAGQYTYTPELDIVGCTSSLTETVTINVNSVSAPTGDALQDYTTGDYLSEFEVTGSNLTWYVMNSEGGYEEVSINSLIVHGQTYYVTQMLNGCESDFLEVTANLECPAPTNLDLNVSASTDGQSGAIVVTWDEPSDLTSVLGYYVVITDVNGNQLFDELIDEGDDYAVFTGLDLDTDYELQVYSVCDQNIPVYSAIDSVSFNTDNLSSNSVIFGDLSFYPNPTADNLHIENNLSIDALELYSLTGQRILTRTVNNTNVTVDLSALASGVYFVNVKVGNANKVIRVVKQ